MEWSTIQYYFYPGLIIFLLLIVIFKVKKIDKPLRNIKFWVVWTVSTLITGTSLIVFVTVFLMNIIFPPEHNFASKSFDNKLWLSNPNNRTEIIASLIKSKLLDHKSKADIIKLLGQPMDSCTYASSKRQDLTYYLGPERSAISVDSEWLVIRLDNDTVKNYDLHRD